MTEKNQSQQDNQKTINEENNEENKEFKEDKKEINQDENKRIVELTETLQRLQAEFENYKKRAEKECIAYREYAEESLIKELLPVLDSFEMALKNNNDTGLKTLFAQFYSVLESRGLKKVFPLNERFDPYRHEVLMQGNDKNKEDNIITEVFQAGYVLKNKIIRCAKVKINKVSKDAKTDVQPKELGDTGVSAKG